MRPASPSCYTPTMTPALRTILLLTVSLIILILGAAGIITVLGIGNAEEIREALWIALKIIAIVSLVSIGLSLLLGGKGGKSDGNPPAPKAP
jgi:hypothetical protein